jgi:hypothetical protein
MGLGLYFGAVNALDSVEEYNVFQNRKATKENVLLRTDTNRPSSLCRFIHDRMAVDTSIS